MFASILCFFFFFGWRVHFLDVQLFELVLAPIQAIQIPGISPVYEPNLFSKLPIKDDTVGGALLSVLRLIFNSYLPFFPSSYEM